MDVIPNMSGVPVIGGLLSKDATGSDKEEQEQAKAAPKKEEKEEKPVEKTVVAKEAKKVDAPNAVAPTGGNRVLNITAPDNKGRKSDPIPTKGHAEGGNRVSVEKINGGPSSNQDVKTAVDVAVTAVVDAAAGAPSESKTSSAPSASLAAEAEKELSGASASAFAAEKSMIDEELAKAHALMKRTVDETYLKDLEELSTSALKIRVVQLASEMNERAKWEAVRLKEFLAMKEKEVGEKYMGKMQKQRFEFEDILARRLREQEGSITKAANDALEAKDRSIESVVNAAASAQQAEYQAALESNTSGIRAELSATYESEFGNKLAEEKSAMIKDLEKKLAAIEDLAERLQQAEQNLQISRNFESGSQRAHRVSAAALALAEKMESSKGALEEFAALKAAAVEDGVIASALEQIPSSVKTGIPTLPELQAGFGPVYLVGREAAYVPTGRSGIGGQLAGKAFATLSGAPSHDTTAPPADDEGKMADYILARAKHYVHVGDLEKAVIELDQLKGQASFTIKDWTVSAKDRIAVEKALKVIKMECALLNKNMGG